jgi:hypothetical protein
MACRNKKENKDMLNLKQRAVVMGRVYVLLSSPGAALADGEAVGGGAGCKANGQAVATAAQTVQPFGEVVVKDNAPIADDVAQFKDTLCQCGQPRFARGVARGQLLHDAEPISSRRSEQISPFGECRAHSGPHHGAIRALLARRQCPFTVGKHGRDDNL